MGMYVCVYIYIYICVYTHASMHVSYLTLSLSLYIYIYIYICIYVYDICIYRPERSASVALSRFLVGFFPAERASYEAHGRRVQAPL